MLKEHFYKILDLNINIIAIIAYDSMIDYNKLK